MPCYIATFSLNTVSKDDIDRTNEASMDIKDAEPPAEGSCIDRAHWRVLKRQLTSCIIIVNFGAICNMCKCYYVASQ